MGVVLQSPPETMTPVIVSNNRYGQVTFYLTALGQVWCWYPNGLCGNGTGPEWWRYEPLDIHLPITDLVFWEVYQFTDKWGNCWVFNNSEWVNRGPVGGGGA